MQTVDYYEVLQGAADLCGLNRDAISTAEQGTLRTMISKRLGTAWHWQWWPDLCRMEQRWYRANYDGTKTYGLGDEVFDPTTQLYYVSLFAANVGNAVTNATWWAVATSLNPNISKEQTGQTVIGDVRGVWDANRWLNKGVAAAVNYEISYNGIQVTEDKVFVWVEFRLRAPVLTGSKWDSTLTYAVGQQVYYRSTGLAGNFYTAPGATVAGQSPETNPELWSVVQIPQWFKGYLEHGAAADYLMIQGEDEAGPQRGVAEILLAEAATVLLGQEGQTQRTEVMTR